MEHMEEAEAKEATRHLEVEVKLQVKLCLQEAAIDMTTASAHRRPLRQLQLPARDILASSY